MWLGSGFFPVVVVEANYVNIDTRGCWKQSSCPFVLFHKFRSIFLSNSSSIFIETLHFWYCHLIISKIQQLQISVSWSDCISLTTQNSPCTMKSLEWKLKDNKWTLFGKQRLIPLKGKQTWHWMFRGRSKIRVTPTEAGLVLLPVCRWVSIPPETPLLLFISAALTDSPSQSFVIIHKQINRII